jgi:signal transduction histidine kinase
MSLVTLRKMTAQLPDALITPFEIVGRTGCDDLVDLSALTAPQSTNISSGLAWVELPTLGADGGITGVLCRSASIDFPAQVPRQVARGGIHAYAHDLGNLLAVIEGGLRLLAGKSDAGDRAMIVEKLHRTVERGAALSRRMLDDSESDEAGDTDLPSGHEQIVDVGDLLDRSLQADVVVDTDIDPSLRRFRADPEQLHLALLNLCKNAADAMPSGGAISITARNLRARPGFCWVEIAVADDGIGMQPDVLSRIFEPYFTTKAPGKGTGLGLAEVKRFVERSGGMVVAESKENEGTTVRMFFPCS